MAEAAEAAEALEPLEATVHLRVAAGSRTLASHVRRLSDPAVVHGQGCNLVAECPGSPAGTPDARTPAKGTPDARTPAMGGPESPAVGPLVGPESPEEEGTQDAEIPAVGTPAVGPENPAVGPENPAAALAALLVLHSRAPK